MLAERASHMGGIKGGKLIAEKISIRQAAK